MIFKNIVPPPSKDDDRIVPKPDDEKTLRKPPSPSQQGRFQGALDEKKKVEDKPKKPVAEGEEEGEKTSIFHLAKPKSTREREGGEQQPGGQGGGGQQGSQQQFTGQQQFAEQQQFAGQHGEEAPETVDISAIEGGKGPAKPITGEARERVAFVHPEEEHKPQPIIGKKEEQAILPEQEDADIQPRQAPLQPPIASETVAKPETPVEARETVRTPIADLVKQAVEAITVMTSKSETTTTVTLRYPPLFEGATLTVKESLTARHEYNITFARLTPEARQMIGAVSAQEQLRTNLIEKGYTVHMVSIEPAIKTVTPTIEESRTGGQQYGEGRRGSEETGGESSGQKKSR